MKKLLSIVLSLSLIAAFVPMTAMADNIDTTIKESGGDRSGEASISLTAVVPEPPANTYTIAVSANPSAGGTVSGGGDFAENASVTVTATANSGYSFVKWTENGEQVSTNANYTFTATANRTLVAVFESNANLYTITVDPGDGTGDAFTVNNATVISRADRVAGNYDQTKGCFYLENDGNVYYSLPPQCSFTAPEGKEFDCWDCSFGGTFDGGSVFKIASVGNFTITALWKDKSPDPQSSVKLSIPSSIAINYGDTKTEFDIVVKEYTFDQTDCVSIVLWRSEFTNANGDKIPFTVGCEGVNAWKSDVAGWAKCDLFTDSFTVPYKIKGFINISNEAWESAKPGSYTATLKLEARF